MIGDPPLAEEVLADLAGYGLGQLVDEMDVLRDLEVGDPAGQGGWGPSSDPGPL